PLFTSYRVTGNQRPCRGRCVRTRRAPPAIKRAGLRFGGCQSLPRRKRPRTQDITPASPRSPIVFANKTTASGGLPSTPAPFAGPDLLPVQLQRTAHRRQVDALERKRSPRTRAPDEALSAIVSARRIRQSIRLPDIFSGKRSLRTSSGFMPPL